MPDLCDFSITQSASALKSRSISCRELVDALIVRSTDLSTLNAFTSYDWDTLRKSADQVDMKGNAGEGLTGIPLVLKDNINTTSLKTSAATGALKDNVAKADAPVAKALFDAGALLGAKGNMHELAFGVTTNNALTGAAKNPYDSDMIPGGSSGGVAVAVAAGMMPGGIGTDTGASVRLPAALCGLVGFRPTVGRYSGEGIVPISATRDTAGPITRSVDDVVLLDSVLAGTTSSIGNADAKSFSLGVPRNYFYDDLDPDIASEAERVLALLEGAGIELREVDIPDVGAINEATSFPIALYEFMRDVPLYLAASGINLSMQDIYDGVACPDVKGVFGSQMGDEAMPEAVYQNAMDVERPKLQQAYRDAFTNAGVDALIFPTAPLPARPIGQDETVDLNGVQQPTFPTFIRNTDPASNAAIPGISLPTGLTGTGLPVGMELDGPAGNDEQLLAIAKTIEEIVGFNAKPNL